MFLTLLDFTCYGKESRNHCISAYIPLNFIMSFSLWCPFWLRVSFVVELRKAAVLYFLVLVRERPPCYFLARPATTISHILLRRVVCCMDTMGIFDLCLLFYFEEKAAGLVREFQHSILYSAIEDMLLISPFSNHL